MRFGVLGDAKIARTKLLPAIRAAGHEVTHLGRCDASTGADPVWGPVTVTSYEGLLQDPQVDAVYNALPNHLHGPWSLQALAAGKQVQEFDGKPYVLEHWLKADFAFVKGALGDTYGNLTYRLAGRNFNPLMCMAARKMQTPSH